MAKFEINGVELEFDILDADKAALYEKEADKLQKAGKAIEGEKSLSKIIRGQCGAIFKFINALFGAGTDKRLFGETVNLSVCLETYYKILEEINKDEQVLYNLTARAQGTGKLPGAAKK